MSSFSRVLSMVRSCPFVVYIHEICGFFFLSCVVLAALWCLDSMLAPKIFELIEPAGVHFVLPPAAAGLIANATTAAESVEDGPSEEDGPAETQDAAAACPMEKDGPDQACPEEENWPAAGEACPEDEGQEETGRHHQHPGAGGPLGPHERASSRNHGALPERTKPSSHTDLRTQEPVRWAPRGRVDARRLA